MDRKPSYGELEIKIAELTAELKSSEIKHQKDKNRLLNNIATLEQSETFFEAVLEQSPFPIVIAAADGTLLAINSVCKKLLNNPDMGVGIPLSETKGLWQHFDTDNNQIPFEDLPIFRALRGNVTKNKEVKVIRGSSEPSWELITSSPIYDKNNQIIAAFLTFPDITDRVEAISKLSENEAHYRNLFDNAGISIWNQDLSSVYETLEQYRNQGIEDLQQHIKDHPQLLADLMSVPKILDVNRATLALFGLKTKSEIIQNIHKFLGANALEVFVKELNAIWNKQSFFVSEANFLSSTGQEIKAIISYNIPNTIEGFKNIPITIQDITEFDYQKDRLNAIVEALPDVTFILDEDGKYIEILTSRHDLLYDELQMLKGNNIHNFLPKEKANFFIDTIRKTIEHKEKQIVEYELSLPQGRVWFEGRVTPMDNTFNKRRTVVWLAVDITEHKKTEHQLRQSQKMQAIGMLTGGIAHEFNNLLSPILGYTELFLTDKDENDPDYKALYQIFTAGNRAKVLVQQLLAYGRQSMSQKEVISLVSIIVDTLELLQSTIPANINIRMDIDENLPTINGMPNEIQQVVLNLCVNAFHSMPTGGELALSLKIKNPLKQSKKSKPLQNNSFICFGVSDTGNGIKQEVLDYIFDPFFTTKEVGQGTGLGLSVVQGIIEQHHGFIEVESTVEVGSIFNIYFPIQDGTVKQSQLSKSLLLKGTEHILLVDDEQMVLDLAKNMLEKLGYIVTKFNDPNKAFEHFSCNKNKYDLIITDYGMPKINGIQLVTKIKTIKPEIPIILATGYGDIISKTDIHQLEVKEILIKPFAYKKLSTIVRKVLSD